MRTYRITFTATYNGKEIFEDAEIYNQQLVEENGLSFVEGDEGSFRSEIYFTCEEDELRKLWEECDPLIGETEFLDTISCEDAETFEDCMGLIG